MGDPMPRTALITGASAGLGSEFARQLADRGLNLLLVGRREQRLAKPARALTEDRDITVDCFAADLSQPQAPEQIAAFARDKGIEVDYLINNAGSAGPHLLEEEDWQVQADFLELMMLSVTHMCHHFIPPMRKRGFGRVINVSSFAGRG